ncbi:MAG: hypothetical protein Q4C22_03930 [Bacillota bacterium]|nr:hypothetical protein [Bacillota bacterium]
MGSQLLLMILAVALGLLLGKIKLGKFSLGGSGALFVGLAVGWAVYRWCGSIMAAGEGNRHYALAEALLSQGIIADDFLNLFLLLFVASVGLLAAKDMAAVLKKYGPRFILLGLLVTLIGAAATCGVSLLHPETEKYQMAGVYTGALTSSPGLGAAVETAATHAQTLADRFGELPQEQRLEIALGIDEEQAEETAASGSLTRTQKAAYVSHAQASTGAGYAIGYPFGVLVVILGINLLPRLFRLDPEKEKALFLEEMQQARAGAQRREVEEKPFDLLAFSLVCLLGYTLGSLRLYLGPLGYFGLGSTGGTLILALILGYIGKLGPLHFHMDGRTISAVQHLGMVFFLAIVGLKYGYKAVETLQGPGAFLALASVLVATVTLLAAFVIGRYALKLNWVILSGAVCGGMTSTPGLGTAIDSLKSEGPAAGYGATYPFALLGMVLFTILFFILPV